MGIDERDYARDDAADDDLDDVEWCDACGEPEDYCACDEDDDFDDDWEDEDE